VSIAMSLVGRVFSNRYEIQRELAQGGMAEVYLGIDRLLGRDVAVKVMWEGLARDDRFLARFRREARAAAALNHPGIVAVHDTGTHEGTPFIVMELVRGRSLSEVIWAEAPLAPARSAEIAESVADALASAHAAGVVHRDVKPANIMLTPSGAVKVLDFGIARASAWTPLTAAPTGHGTPEYVSPEQARGEDSDGRSDIYSLGVVLFEMVTGRPPFTGESPLVVAYRHVREPAATPSSINRAVPPALDSIIMRCLAKAPEHRYQRASQLRQDLRRLADHTPSATLPVSRPPWDGRTAAGDGPSPRWRSWA
jgi:serine/threonine-protein kinase